MTEQIYPIILSNKKSILSEDLNNILDKLSYQLRLVSLIAPDTMNAHYISVGGNIKKGERIYLKDDVGMNNLRHSATTYDEVNKTLRQLTKDNNWSKDFENKVNSKLKNKINEEISKAKTEWQDKVHRIEINSKMEIIKEQEKTIETQQETIKKNEAKIAEHKEVSDYVLEELGQLNKQKLELEMKIKELEKNANFKRAQTAMSKAGALKTELKALVNRVLRNDPKAVEYAQSKADKYGW